MMTRRAFLMAVGAGIAAAPLAADAQPVGRVWRIGVLQPGEAVRYMEGFSSGLAELGWVEGQNVAIEHRIAPAIADHAPLIAELVGLKVDVIVTWTTPAVLAAKRATTTTPIVGISGNPVELGLVATLARPGGNVTGIAILTDEMEVKNLELLKQTVPAASRVAVLSNPQNPLWGPVLKRLRDVAPALGVKIQSVEVQDPADLDKAFANARRERADALLVVNEALFGISRKRIAELAAEYRLPAIYGSSRAIDADGLMSHGPNMPAMLRRAAVYVHKILKGAKPADLPVEQPTTFELIINLKTAKALGLTIPQSVLVRADRVIQ